jgi:hypothetical protein
MLGKNPAPKGAGFFVETTRNARLSKNRLKTEKSVLLSNFSSAKLCNNLMNSYK